MNEEEINMINQINPKIFGKESIAVELKYCPNCNNLMEFNNNIWYCDCKGEIQTK